MVIGLRFGDGNGEGFLRNAEIAGRNGRCSVAGSIVQFVSKGILHIAFSHIGNFGRSGGCNFKNIARSRNSEAFAVASFYSRQLCAIVSHMVNLPLVFRAVELPALVFRTDGDSLGAVGHRESAIDRCEDVVGSGELRNIGNNSISTRCTGRSGLTSICDGTAQQISVTQSCFRLAKFEARNEGVKIGIFLTIFARCILNRNSKFCLVNRKET